MRLRRPHSNRRAQSWTLWRLRFGRAQEISRTGLMPCVCSDKASFTKAANILFHARFPYELHMNSLLHRQKLPFSVYLSSGQRAVRRLHNKRLFFIGVATQIKLVWRPPKERFAMFKRQVLTTHEVCQATVAVSQHWSRACRRRARTKREKLPWHVRLYRAALFEPLASL